MNQTTIFIVSIAIALIIGFIFGFLLSKSKPNGTIIIEETEDNRERIRWVLDMDLDEIREQKKIIFKVENTLSKNSQPV